MLGQVQSGRGGKRRRLVSRILICIILRVLQHCSICSLLSSFNRKGAGTTCVASNQSLFNNQKMDVTGLGNVGKCKAIVAIYFKMDLLLKARDLIQSLSFSVLFPVSFVPCLCTFLFEAAFETCGEDGTRKSSLRAL